MTHRNHIWRPDAPPPLILPHSVAKHRVFRSYLERYVEVLTTNPAQDRFRLTLVDGFAGGGLYLDSRTSEERAGSPLIMLEAMATARERAQSIRNKPFHLDVQYFFVEKDPEAIQYLRRLLLDSPYRSMVDDSIHLINGEFVTNADKITHIIRDRGRANRAIFFLDQFGYTEVPLSTIRSILGTLDKAEVILTFAVDFLIDYLSKSEQTQKALEKVGLSLPPSDITLAKADEQWRRTIQFSLHEQIPKQTGAEFYTPFFIRSAESHRDLWLIHLSGHSRARDVMVDLHWRESTSFAHFGGSGLRMLGYDQRHDSEWTRQRLLPIFQFDELALASSRDELLSDLPKRLADEFGDIAFGDLFSKLTNETPVTSEIMAGVLYELAREGVIDVRSKLGERSKASRVQRSDIISISKQKKLFGP